jgi:Uma2 family endonuclease
MAIKEERMTLEAFLELPEEEPALEFEDGMVTQKVPPKGRHAALQAAMTGLVNAITLPTKTARALPELRATFAGRSLVPDVAVYLWDRVPRNARGQIADDFFDPPDIAIEIISPGQSVNALIRRCLNFVNTGVKAALLVDPDHESISVFRPGLPPMVLGESDEVDLADIVPGLHLPVREIFDALMM